MRRVQRPGTIRSRHRHTSASAAAILGAAMLLGYPPAAARAATIALGNVNRSATASVFLDDGSLANGIDPALQQSQFTNSPSTGVFDSGTLTSSISRNGDSITATASQQSLIQVDGAAATFNSRGTVGIRFTDGSPGNLVPYSFLPSGGASVSFGSTAFNLVFALDQATSYTYTGSLSTTGGEPSINFGLFDNATNAQIAGLGASNGTFQPGSYRFTVVLNQFVNPFHSPLITAGTSDFNFNLSLSPLAPTDPAAVPLPSTAWGGLALCGAFGAVKLRRRRAT